jgi:methylisocitrate lyase
MTPLLTLDELRQTGVRLALYPLSAFRAMNKAAATVYETVRTQGTQQGAVNLMQTRAELYEVLHYQAYEQKLDRLFAEKKATGES